MSAKTGDEYLGVYLPVGAATTRSRQVARRGLGQGHLLSAANLGRQITAVNADTLPWPERDATAHPDLIARLDSITLAQAEVRESSIGRNAYDLIFIQALHELEVPDQVSLVRKCLGTPRLIDYRIASEQIGTPGDYRATLIQELGEAREKRDGLTTPSSRKASAFFHTRVSVAPVARLRLPHRAWAWSL